MGARPWSTLLRALMLCGLTACNEGAVDDEVKDPAGWETVDTLQAMAKRGAWTELDSMALAVLRTMGTEGNDSIRLRVELNRGISHDRRGAHDTAVAIYERVVNGALGIGDSVLQDLAVVELANTRMAQGDHVRALEQLFRSLEMRERAGDSAKVASCLVRIAGVLYQQDEDSASLAYSERGYAIYEALGDSVGMTVAGNNMANTMLALGDHRGCLQLQRRNIAIRSRIQPDRSRAAMENVLTRAFIAAGELDSAKAHAEETLRQARAHQEAHLEALAWLGLAKTLRASGDLEKASRYADSTLQRAQLLGRPEQASDAAKELYLLARDRGLYQDALRYHELYAAYEDSLISKERDALGLRLRAQYEVARKDKDNRVLQETTRLALAEGERSKFLLWSIAAVSVAVISVVTTLLLIARQRAWRKESDLSQQLLRARMDPHFLFNALNAVPGLFAQHGAFRTNDYLAHLSKFLRMVLETNDQNVITLAKEIELAEHYLSVSADRNPGVFDWSFNVMPSVSPDTCGVPPMILQPLVENAIEHGFANRADGRLSISVDSMDDILRIEVKDNGIGRTAAMMRRKALDRRASGLLLVQQRLAFFDRRSRKEELMSIEDIVADDGSPLGTRVTLRFRSMTMTHQYATGDRR